MTLLLLSIALPAQAAAPITGRWTTQDGKAIVAVEQCGAAVCGRVVRLLAASKGAPATDVRNADPALRTRSMLGLPVLSGFVDGGSEWRGSIYSPEEGKSYKGFASRNADGSLKLRGCWYFICRTIAWKAAE